MTLAVIMVNLTCHKVMFLYDILELFLASEKRGEDDEIYGRIRDAQPTELARAPS